MAKVVKRGKYYYIKYKDVDGKWKRKAVGRNATKAEAEYLAKEYSAKELNYHHSAPVRIISTTVEKTLVTFRDEELKRSPVGIEKQESSINREKAALNNVIKFVKKQNIVQMKHFTRSTVADYMDSRAEMARRTRREELRVLKRFFKWAKKKHLVSENPLEDLRAPKPEKKPLRYYTNDELDAIISKAKAPYDRIFEFLYLTGLRTGELANLEWRDYNWENRVLTIRVVSADKKARTPGNKTKRVETIPINDDAHTILEQRKASGDSNRFIFLNAEGNRLDNENMYRNLKRILTKLEIADACVHTFRHTFASHLVIKGVSIISCGI